MDRRVHVEQTMVPMADGVGLATDVFIPDEGGRYPALLVRTPYGRAGSRMEYDPVKLVRKGWAVVIQDVRGRFESEGKFEPFHQEIADGAAAIRWCATRPWCDTRVVMSGRSYVGATATLAALGRTTELRAIAPQMTADDFNDGWTYEGGAMRAGFSRTWGAGFATGNGYTPSAQKRALQLALDPDSLLTKPSNARTLARVFPPYSRWQDPRDDAYWKPISMRRSGRGIDLAAIHVAGWFDIFCESSIRYYSTMLESARTEHGRKQRLIIGPWTHDRPFGHLTPEVDFGISANWNLGEKILEIIDWMRDAIDDKPVDTGALVFVMGRNIWQEMSSWPPRARNLKLYLHSSEGANSADGDGELLRRPKGSDGKDVYVHDPLSPVPSAGGRILSSTIPVAGPADQRDVERRNDVLVYTSGPLETEVTVAGLVKANIHFASTRSSGDVNVKLVDVHPDGRAIGVVDSVRRTALTPGRRRAVEVDVGSTAITFFEGHRIRVEIASSNFPRLDINPSTSDNAATATTFLKATHTVFHGGRAASYIELPVIA